MDDVFEDIINRQQQNICELLRPINAHLLEARGPWGCVLYWIDLFVLF